MPGHRARVRGEQRHERASLEPDAPHQAVDHEGGARHVADVLEQVEQREEQHDLRQEDDHGADAGDQPVGEEIGDDARRQRRVRPRAPRSRRRRRSRSSPAPPTTKISWKKTTITNAKSSAPANGCSTTRSIASVRAARPRPARQHAREHRGGPAGALLGGFRRQQHAAGSSARASRAASRSARARARGGRPRRARGCRARARGAARSSVPPRACSSSVIVSTRQAGSPRRSTCAISSSERSSVQASATITSASGAGPSSPSITRVDHGFVRADRRQAVGAGQVDHQQPARPSISSSPFAALDGHARVVPDLRAQSGQRVEERRLAGVRAADQAQAQRAPGAEADLAHERRAARDRVGDDQHPQRLAAAQAERDSRAARRRPDRRAARGARRGSACRGRKPRSSEPAADGASTPRRTRSPRARRVRGSRAEPRARRGALRHRRAHARHPAISRS